MDESERDRRAEEMINRMKQARGYMYPAMELAIRLDPDFMQAYDKVAGMALLHEAPAQEEDNALPARYRELVVIGILAFRGNLDGVVTHMKRALSLGATEQELLEALEAAFIPGGAPTFLLGLKALLSIKEGTV